MLRDEMERAGDWLFRWRSYLPLLMLPVLGAALCGFTYPRGDQRLHEWWEAGALLISLLGLGVRAAVAGYAPAGTSGRNTREGQVASALNTTGMYSLVRHPLYVGNYLMWAGVALVPRSAWLVAVVTFAYALYYERIMLAEEAFLRRRFGTSFERWAAHTPAIIPRLRATAGGPLRGWRRPEVPFSWRTVLRREYSGAFALAVLFATVGTAANAAAAGRVSADVVDALDTGLLVVGAVTYLVLRALKRRTHLLDVAGR